MTGELLGGIVAWGILLGVALLLLAGKDSDDERRGGPR